MGSTSFEAQVTNEDSRSTIKLFGEINATADKELSNAYSLAAIGNPSTIMLDFGSVTYINSTGIALIVGLLAQARTSHTSLVVYGLSEHYEEIFRITRLSDFMNIFPDKGSAIQEVSN